MEAETTVVINTPVACKHEGEEFIYVMSGELELTPGSKAQVLKAGGHTYFDCYIPHTLKNLFSQYTRCRVALYTA